MYCPSVFPCDLVQLSICAQKDLYCLRALLQVPRNLQKSAGKPCVDLKNGQLVLQRLKCATSIGTTEKRKSNLIVSVKKDILWANEVLKNNPSKSYVLKGR